MAAPLKGESLGLEGALPLSVGAAGMSVREQVGQAYEEQGRAVCRYLLMMRIPPAQAEELCQESFVRLFCALMKRENIENVRAWLFRTVHNLALKWLESAGVRERHATEWIDAVVEAKPDPQLNPEQEVLEHERYISVHRALAGLSPRQRQCLYLRAEGFRYREIAEMTNLSMATVVEYLRRAIIQLQKLNL